MLFIVTVALSLLSPSAGQKSSGGLDKITWTVDNPIANWDWFMKYLPVEDDPNSCPDNTCACSTEGRVGLLTSSSLSSSDSSASPFAKEQQARRRLMTDGFGIHNVNCSSHPSGTKTTKDVEEIFTAKFGDFTDYDAFMDYNAGFMTSDLDSLVDSFDADGVTYLPLEYTDPASGEGYYSVLVQVLSTQTILEFVDATAAAATASKRLPVHPRLKKMPHGGRVRSASIEAARARLKLSSSSGGGSGGGSAAMTNAWISRAASDLTAVKTFYEAMGCSTSTSTSGDVSTLEVSWPDIDAPVVFVKRADNATSSDFSVADFEAYMLSTHAASLTAYDDTYGFATCGFDKWFDNHYGTKSNEYLDVFVDAILGLPSSLPTSYWTPRQWEGSSSMMKLYWTDPTGMGIQVEGDWDPKGSYSEYMWANAPVQESGNNYGQCGCGEGGDC
jgi:hypothetical protein